MVMKIRAAPITVSTVELYKLATFIVLFDISLLLNSIRYIAPQFSVRFLLNG